MKYSALIGTPVDHSVSHILYKELFKCSTLEGSYEHIRIPVAASELRASIEAFNILHFVGLNVTLPHKVAVMPFLDKIDPVARELGAVNTIKLGEKTTGYNTDWIGIAESVRQFGVHKRGSAVIFGTGGAARAAIYACKQLHIQAITVLYRTPNSQNTLDLLAESHQLGVTMLPFKEASQAILGTDLVINATSAGMTGQDNSPFDVDLIKTGTLRDVTFLDAVFNPVDTPLLAYFKANNATTIDGLWMMIYQAVGAMGIWFDREIDVAPEKLQNIHDLLEKEISNV